MKSKLWLLAHLYVATLSAQTVEKYPAASDNPIGYWVQRPANYDGNVNIDFHGVGGRGPGSAATLDQLIIGTPPPYAETPKDLQNGCAANGILLIAPQIGGDWTIAQVNSFVDIAFTKFRAKRVGISGFSLGGGAVTAYITSQYSGRISWAISANGLNWGEKYPGANWANAKNVRVWFFHTKDDPRVPISNSASAVVSMNQVGGGFLYTINETGGHSYNNFYKSPELYRWMLGSDTLPKVPVPAPATEPVFDIGADTVITTNSITIVPRDTSNILKTYDAFEWQLKTEVGTYQPTYNPAGIYGFQKTFGNLSAGVYEIFCTAKGSNGVKVIKSKKVTVKTGSTPPQATEMKAVLQLENGTKWNVTLVLLNGFWMIKGN
jgi:predicted esterase